MLRKVISEKKEVDYSDIKCGGFFIHKDKVYIKTSHVDSGHFCSQEIGNDQFITLNPYERVHPVDIRGSVRPVMIQLTTQYLGD